MRKHKIFVFVLFLLMLVCSACHENHSLIKIDYKPANCIEDGNYEYYKCKDCGKIYSDASGKVEIESVPIIKANHEIVKVPNKYPSYYEDGNYEYYKCNICNKLFSDEKGENEIENIPIISKKNRFTDTYFYNDNGHWKKSIIDDDFTEETHVFEDDCCKICGYKKDRPNKLSMEFLRKRFYLDINDIEPKKTSGIKISSDNIEIYESGTYVISDSNINTVFVGSNDIILVLDNVVLNGSILINDDINDLKICLEDDSVNVINAESLLDARINLTIFGKGKLKLNNNSYQDNISCERINIVDSDIEFDTKGIGIKADVLVSKHSKLSIVTESDAIYIRDKALFSDCSIDIKTSGGYVSNTDENMLKYNLTQSDYIYRKAEDSYGSSIGKYNEYASIRKSRGIFVEGDYDSFIDKSLEFVESGIIIQDSILDIEANEDCIFSEYGFVDITNSKVNLTSLSNGIRASTIFNSEQSEIIVTHSYEAIEAAHIQFKNDIVNANSIDDSIESSSDYGKESNVIIDGGHIEVVSIRDDGFDVVNNLYIIDGYVKSSGIYEGESFDCDGCLIIDGGTIIAPTHHTVINISEESKQNILFVNKDYPKTWNSGKFTLYDESGKEVVSTDIDFEFGNVIISIENIEIGKYYLIRINDEFEKGFLFDKKIVRISE